MTIQSNHGVTLRAREAFYSHQPFTEGDTVITVGIHHVNYRFYGHKIAILNKETGALLIQTKHVRDKAFRDRLNSLDDVHVVMITKKCYLNGIPWNGSKAQVLKGFEYVKE